MVQVREVALLSLDDLLIVAREFLNPDLSRAALDRCLRRHGVSDLQALKHEQAGEPVEPGHKPLKDYVPGFVHVDVKYLPQMADESSRGFLKKLIERPPFHVTQVATDNGKEFTDRFAATGEREPAGRRPFDRLCADHGIEHRLIRPKRPQTNGNGLVERFNGRIADLLRTRRFDSGAHLQYTLRDYQLLYNHHIGQKAQLRSIVEHPFHVVKNLFGYHKVRYQGLRKNTAQLHSLFALANLYRARRWGLLPQG